LQYFADDVHVDTATEIAEILAAQALRNAAAGVAPEPPPEQGKKRPRTRTLAEAVQTSFLASGYRDAPDRVLIGETWQDADQPVVFDMAAGLAFQLPLPSSCVFLPDASVGQRWKCYLLMPPPDGFDVLDLVVKPCEPTCTGPPGTGLRSHDGTTWFGETTANSGRVYELSLYHRDPARSVSARVRVTPENAAVAQKIVNDIWSQLAAG
jgi:hypothetical protein